LCQYHFMKHKYQLAVRSYECDMHRHVNNAIYLQYLEAARMGFLEDSDFDYDGFLDAGYALFVANINISYKAPAFFGDRLSIETSPLRRKRFSGTFLQEVKRDDTLLASAEVKWSCVNREGRPVPLPEEFDGPWLEP